MLCRDNIEIVRNCLTEVQSAQALLDMYHGNSDVEESPIVIATKLLSKGMDLNEAFVHVSHFN